MAPPPGGGYAPPRVLPAARPREIGVVRGLLFTTMALCLVGAAGSLDSLSREVTPEAVLTATAPADFAVQSITSPAPLSRGSRVAWVWTLASTVMGLLSGVPVIAMGLAWFADRPYVLGVGLVWTALYATLMGALTSRPVRDWIFG